MALGSPSVDTEVPSDMDKDHAASQPAKPALARPFTPRQLARLDEALTMSSRETGLTLSIYVGDLTESTRAYAEQLHDQLEDPATSVLLAISPGQRVLEIVTGSTSSRRLPDRACALAALSMRAAFSGGDLVGGVVTGLRMLADQAGRRP